LLHAAGFKLTVAPPRPPRQGIVKGVFDPNFPLGANDPEALRGRYGLDIAETQGSIPGEGGNLDPAEIARWLRDEGPRGGVAFLRSVADQGGAQTVNPPDAVDVNDLRYISRDGQRTAYQELIQPWLEAEPGQTGGQTSETSSTKRSLGDEVASFTDPISGRRYVVRWEG
jgi:hypothetical protein